MCCATVDDEYEKVNKYRSAVQSLVICVFFQVEYSQRYAETNPQAQSLRHLLSEAHLLLRAALLHASDEQQTGPGGPADHRTDRQVLEEALRENCAQLGDSFSR